MPKKMGANWKSYAKENANEDQEKTFMVLAFHRKGKEWATIKIQGVHGLSFYIKS